MPGRILKVESRVSVNARIERSIENGSTESDQISRESVTTER